MIVFKTYLKVVSKHKLSILMYTMILIIFGIFTVKNGNQATSFVASKPSIAIINHDDGGLISDSLVEYLHENSNVVKLKNISIKDALFYRDINYVIEIPENYSKSFFNKDVLELKVQSTNDYPAKIASNLVERFLSVAHLCQELNLNEEKLVLKVKESLKKNITTKVESTLNYTKLEKTVNYYNFLNYCLLAGFIYVICLILSSFKNETIEKRMIISSITPKRFNLSLLLSNSIFALFLWAFYVILSMLFIGNLFSTFHGIIFVFNSFFFSLCALTIAFFLGSIVKNRDIINGIVNVVALGSSFLCGSFVPIKWLPASVLRIAHLLPSYYYIKNNNLILELDTLNYTTLKPYIFNLIVILLFAFIFVFLTIMKSNRAKNNS